MRLKATEKLYKVYIYYKQQYILYVQAHESEQNA